MNSKKILLGTLSLGMTIATLQSCNKTKTEPAKETEKMSDAKCGDSTKVTDGKCAGKMSDSTMVKSKEGKCGEGKCGDKKGDKK